MKEKTIPLYFKSYSTRYYLTHPWKYFKDIKTLISNARHRMRCGYAWVDLWNMDDYLGQLIPNMLHELADRSCGWPQSDEHPEFENWQTELHILASLFDLLNIDVLMDRQLFETKFAEYRGGLTIYPLKDTTFFSKYVINEEEGKRIDTAETDWHRTQIERDILRKKIFSRLAELWDGLWD